MSKLVDTKQSDQTLVISRFLFKYKSVGEYFSVNISAASLNDAMTKFATRYHFIEEVFSITKVSENGL